MRYSELATALKPYILGWLSDAGGGAGPYAPTPHDLNSSHHSGELADSQFTSALLRDGSRSLLDDLAVADTKTLDGVDLSVFKSDYDVHALTDDAHHDPVTIGSGGLSAKLALSAQELTLAAIDHFDLSGIPANTHVDHTGVSISAGAGLTGGGNISASRSLAVDTGYSFTWTAAHAFQGTITVRDIVPQTHRTYDLGSTGVWVAEAFIDDLHAGTIQTAVFEADVVHVFNGSNLIAKASCALATAKTFPASGSDTFVANKTGRFAVGDRVRLKNATSDTWLSVTGIGSDPTISVTVQDGGGGSFAAGDAVANYGASGQGLILLTSNDIGTVGAPAISIFSHAGSPWTTQTEHVRIGNLDGSFGITTDLYGFAAGDYGDENYISYDPTNGFLVSAGDGKVTIDADGILLGDGSASTPGAGSLRWDNSSRIYEYVIADDVSSGNDSITLSLYGRNDGTTSTDWGAVEIAAYRWVAGAGSSTRRASLDLYSFGGLAIYEPKIKASVQSGSGPEVYWELDTGAMKVMGAELQVGATLGSSPSLGEGDLTIKDDLWVEGDYKKVISSTDYDICFPYTATKDSLTSNANIGTSWTTILTRTITVPAAARIKATVSGYWIDSSHSANGDLYFRIVIDGTTVAQVYQVSWQIYDRGNIAMFGWKDVSSGSRTITLQAYKSTSSLTAACGSDYTSLYCEVWHGH